MTWRTRQGREDALYAAIYAGQSLRVRALLKIEPSLVNSTRRKPPPLHWAVHRNRLSMVVLLLDAGADIQLRDSERGY